MNTSKKVIYCAILMAIQGSAWSEDKKSVPVVPVVGSVPADASAKTNTATNPSSGKPADGGAWMKKIPGVSGVRMGGHGVDPVVRGQKATQVNVILDGAFVHGGCPNRMDPPSSYANPAGYDLITVLKGTQSLIYGAGGPGGTVLFERTDPKFEAGKDTTGGIGGGYKSNGSTRSYDANVAAGDRSRFVRAVLSRQIAGNYEDGDNNEVRSAYREKAATLDMVFKPTSTSRLGLALEGRRGSDILFAGAGMDSPVADNDMIKLSYKNDGGSGFFSSSKVELYKSSVFHVMDNFSLRPAGMMKARVPSDSDTLGGRIIGEHATKKGMLTLGVDLQNNDRDATRYAGMMAPTAINSYLWPGVSIDQVGVFAEYNYKASRTSRYVFGVRFDRVDADASKADLVPMMMAISPNTLYQTYNNGATATPVSENNVSALARFEKDMNRQTTWHVGFSRTMRTADATERYMASNNSNLNMRWIGNPVLDPEAHHQLEVGIKHKKGVMEFSGLAYYNRVSDYILRTRFHVTGNNATVYRNIDARLIGLETEWSYRISRNLFSRVNLDYVHATDLDNNRPIAQTPPLMASLNLEYKSSGNVVGGTLRMAAKQTRVDTDASTGSGLDVGKTPGYAVLDVYSSGKLAKGVTYRFGIDNVLDKTYAEHLNKSNAFDPTQVQVNEPGRSFWVELAARF